MGYTKDTIRGFSWMGAFRVFTRGFAFVRVAILARLLTPEQFGVFGIASLMLTLIETITQTGISVFLVQEKKKLAEYVDSAYVISVIRGIIISALLFMASPYIANYFRAYETLDLLRLICLVPLIRGFINPSRVKFLKDLEFKQEFWFSFCVFILDSTVSVAIAFWLRSPISLVWGLLSGAVLEALMSHYFIRPRPKFIFDPVKTKDMFNKGKWVTGAGVFAFFFEQGDDMFVGKLLNTTSLGIYQAAYKLSTLPITEITRVFNQVTFPIYSNFAEDTKRLKRAFLRITATILLLIIPIGIVLYFYATEIVVIVLGSNWLEVVPVLKVLSVFGVIRATIVSVNPLFNSAKKQNYLAAITLINLSVMVFTIMPLILRYGVNGAGYSIIIASIVSLPVLYNFLRKVFKD